MSKVIPRATKPRGNGSILVSQFLSSSVIDWTQFLVILITWTSTLKRHSPFEGFSSPERIYWRSPSRDNDTPQWWSYRIPPGSLYLISSKDLFLRSLIISHQGHQHLKIFPPMVSLRKSLEEKYDEITLQQMASQQRSLQISK